MFASRTSKTNETIIANVISADQIRNQRSSSRFRNGRFANNKTNAGVQHTICQSAIDPPSIGSPSAANTRCPVRIETKNPPPAHRAIGRFQAYAINPTRNIDARNTNHNLAGRGAARKASPSNISSAPAPFG